MSVIALDAMGGDHAPGAPVGGALLAAADGIDVALVGDSAVIEAELERRGVPSHALRIIHAPDVVGMDDRAAMEVRRQRRTSLYVGTEQVKSGEVGAMVTLGHTGAAMATALVVLGRLKGVERPALAAPLPAPAGRVLFLDAGANADARPSHLLQFAHMGHAYMQTVFDVERPRVALLSIGEESNKGSHLVLEAHQLLAETRGLHFIGNIEGRDLLNAVADVVVTDGFTGNVCLKLAEGVSSMLFEEMRKVASQSWRMKAGGALIRPGVRDMRDRLDYRRYGAVPLLGVNGAMFIGHGRSDDYAVASALRTAHHAVEQGMLRAQAEAIVGA